MKLFNLEFTWSGIRSIFKKELIQLFRDPYLVAFIILLPVVQLLVTGLAVERDMKHIKMIVCDYDESNASIELRKAFDNSDLFDVVEPMAHSQEQVVQGIRKGQYRVGMIIPPGYSGELMNGSSSAKVDVVIDGMQSTIARSILSGAKLIIANQSKEMIASQQQRLDDAKAGLVDMRAKILFNPQLKSSYFLVPAILAIVMHMLTILFTSFAIVRERESGTLEQLMVTPIRTTDLMIGKVLPYAFIGFIDMILTLVVMILFFDIPISGDFWFLCIASIIFIFTSLGIGLMISTTCQTQVQAIQVTTGFFLPSLLLSGFVFPLEPVPWFIKIVSYCLPMTYYLDIIRGVVIKGVGFQELWFQTIVLIGLATLFMSFSILRFKKQIA